MEWMREHPWAALSLGLAAGFLLAGSRRRRRRIPERWINPRFGVQIEALQRAYLEGRRDERWGLEPRKLTAWRDFKARPTLGGELWRATTDLGGIVAQSASSLWSGVKRLVRR
jgi:hypothetical protein